MFLWACAAVFGYVLLREIIRASEADKEPSFRERFKDLGEDR